jgi:hypothetical protein
MVQFLTTLSKLEEGLVVIDWSKGFRIESDGTIMGTKVFNQDGEPIPNLTYFQLTADVNMLRPSVLAAYGTPPEGIVTGACTLESPDDQVEYDSDGT